MVYVFPLDEGAAVCAFEATVDGVRYVGRAKERDEAFREYDEAVEAGHGAFLLDEERADVFTASLGNMRPGAMVELSLTYVTELAAEGEGVRFTLPTTVSPRYAPEADQNGVGPTPAEALNPPVAWAVPYGFSFEMDAAMSGAIRGVESPSHPIAIELDGCRAKVRLAQRTAAMDRDLVIVLAADGLSAPHAIVERGEKGGAVLLSFLPRFEPAARAAEVIFVIDRSGSMGGDSIAEVRNALQLCLRSLTPGSRFNIVSFGSTYRAAVRREPGLRRGVAWRRGGLRARARRRHGRHRDPAGAAVRGAAAARGRDAAAGAGADRRRGDQHRRRDRARRSATRAPRGSSPSASARARAITW